MSIATMNWALAQRLETPQHQALLYVIADSADPNGVTRHCDPDYMADKARLSRATMFRRLGELEEIGALTRFKFYSERGAPIYEIRINMDAHFDLPIRRRRKDDDDGPETETEVTETPESQPETPPESPAETGAVAPVRQAQSHSCDYISPPLSKSLPPTPLAGGSLSKKETEQTEKRSALWQRFLGSYLGISAMDQQAARAEFDQLSVDDAEWAVSVCGAYDAECRKLKKPPKNAHIWLRKGMFKNFPRAKIEAAPADMVWIREGTDEDRALRFVHQLARKPVPYVHLGQDGSRGYQRKAAVGPDLLAMLAFVDDIPLHWQAYARGTPEFAAWQTRFGTWIGQGLPVEPGNDSLRAPCPWPPKKDGTIYAPEQASDGEPPANGEKQNTSDSITNSEGRAS